MSTNANDPVYYIYSQAVKYITRIAWNYRQACSDGKEVFSEEFDEARLNEGNVVGIYEHTAHGEGDKFFYDIVYNNDTVLRIFNPHQVWFSFKGKDGLIATLNAQK